MKFLKFLLSRLFLKNLFYAIILFAGLLTLTMLVLKIYTRHGQALVVPDLTGKSIGEVMNITKSKKLKFEIVDSVFNSQLTKGSVVEQHPVSGIKVKKRRIIFLVINAYYPEIIPMPKAFQVSKRQALNILDNAGLTISDSLEFEPYPAFDYVLKQKFEGEIIEPGTPIPKGSSIVLVLGQGLADQKTIVPDLIGLNPDSARAITLLSSLNIGAMVYDETILSMEDSLMALIWRQSPESYNNMAKLGTKIDVWLTLDSLKVFTTYPEYQEIFYDDEK